MKIATLFVSGMFLTTVAMSDDSEDVKMAARATYEALNNADVEAYVHWVAPEGTLYGGNGSLLQERNSTTEALRANLQNMFDAGLKYDYRMRNLEVKVYGDSAVVTGYVVGSRTAPDGVTRQVTLRRTMAWIRQGGAWKVVHVHSSPLTISTPSIEDRFVGTWRFVSIEQRNAQGELLPVISRRTGFIIYTPTSHMAVQLMDDDRKEYAAAQPSGEEAQAALASYNAYSGTFTVNEAQGTVTHHRQTKLTPGTVDALGGTDVIRFYRFSGNQLMLTPPPRIIDGEELTRTLIWERVE